MEDELRNRTGLKPNRPNATRVDEDDAQTEGRKTVEAKAISPGVSSHLLRVGKLI